MKAFRGFYFVACAVTALGWIVYAVAQRRVAALICNRLGGEILKLGQGKIRDVNVFVAHRFWESLWLLSLALFLIGAQHCFNHLTRARIGHQRWAVQGFAAFVLLNLWTGAAVHTALFWAAMRAGAGVQNLAQFRFKQVLAEEHSDIRQAVLVGSSQTRAQIDEDLLNELIGRRLWTTELHFPGSHGYDLLLIERQLQPIHPQIVICYVSEGYFYNGSHGEAPPNFLSFRDVPDGLRRGAERYLSSDEIISGLVGDALPLFRCRDAIAQRVFGPTTLHLLQQEYDTSLNSDLNARARQFAVDYRMDRQSDFQKKAFADFIKRCVAAHRRVFLLSGGYNPILERQIDPAVHADMINFLGALQNRYPLVTVVPASDLPDQTPSDYDDLSHVNSAAQRRFTDSLARLLDRSLIDQPAIQ